MAKVKLAFIRLSVPEKILKAKHIVQRLTNNADYPNPNPPLTTLNDAIKALETAAGEAADGGKAKTALMYSKESALNKLITQIAAYVQHASNASELVILGSGFEVRAAKTPPQPLPAPENLIAKTGKNEGEINLRWQKVPKARTYRIQMSANGLDNWQTLEITTTKASAIITGLPVFTKAWFRVCAIGPKGNSPWSDAAQGRTA